MSISSATQMVGGPLIGGWDVTPSDSTDLTRQSRAIKVEVSGNVAVVWADGSEQTIKGLAAGIWHPCAVKRVKATGTTATGIEAGY